jgi:hypothetical protein
MNVKSIDNELRSMMRAQSRRWIDRPTAPEASSDALHGPITRRLFQQHFPEANEDIEELCRMHAYGT